VTVRLNENGREEVDTFPVLQPYSYCTIVWIVLYWYTARYCYTCGDSTESKNSYCWVLQKYLIPKVVYISLRLIGRSY